MLPCVCFSQSNWILCPIAKGPHWVVLVIVLTTRIRQPLSCLLATIATPNEFGFQKRRDHPQQWSNCLGPAIWIDVLQILNIFQYYRPLGSWSDQTLLNTSQSSPRLSKYQVQLSFTLLWCFLKYLLFLISEAENCASKPMIGFWNCFHRNSRNSKPILNILWI